MKARVALMASVFCIALAAVAVAQVSTVEGKVVSNSGGVLVIESDTGQRTFMVDAQSSLPADLAVGSRVRVEYHTLANDRFHAFKVSSLGDTTTTTTTTETTPPATSAAPTTTTTEPTTPTTTTTEPMGTPTGTMQEQPTTPATTTDTTAPADSTRTLPATASPLPLLALAGGLAMAGGALLRRLR